jgi:hypothetical protein
MNTKLMAAALKRMPCKTVEIPATQRGQLPRLEDMGLAVAEKCIDGYWWKATAKGLKFKA